MGGKGVGRLMWLKAFEKAEIDSVFEVDGQLMRRRFDFSLADNGAGNLVTEGASDSKRQTVVRLVGFKSEYRTHCLKATMTIARRIIEHCLQWFIQKGCPSIWLMDQTEDTSVDLNRLFKNEMQLDSSTKGFQVKGKKFRIRHLRLVAGLELEHQLTFTAHNRSVKSESLPKLVPNLEGPLEILRTIDRLQGHGAKCVDDTAICNWLRDQRRAKTTAGGQSNPNQQVTESTGSQVGKQDKRYNLNRWLWQARFVLATAIYSSVTILWLTAWPVSSSDTRVNTVQSQSQPRRNEVFDAAVDLLRASGGVAEAKAALDEVAKAKTAFGKGHP